METQRVIPREYAAVLIRSARAQSKRVYRVRNMGCRSYVLGNVEGLRVFVRVSLSDRTAPCVLRCTF